MSGMQRFLRLSAAEAEAAMKPRLVDGKWKQPLISGRKVAMVKKHAARNGLVGTWEEGKGGWLETWDRAQKHHVMRPLKGHKNQRNEFERCVNGLLGLDDERGSWTDVLLLCVCVQRQEGAGGAGGDAQQDRGTQEGCQAGQAAQGTGQVAQRDGPVLDVEQKQMQTGAGGTKQAIRTLFALVQIGCSSTRFPSLSGDNVVTDALEQGQQHPGPINKNADQALALSAAHSEVTSEPRVQETSRAGGYTKLTSTDHPETPDNQNDVMDISVSQTDSPFSGVPSDYTGDSLESQAELADDDTKSEPVSSSMAQEPASGATTVISSSSEPSRSGQRSPSEIADLISRMKQSQDLSSGTLSFPPEQPVDAEQTPNPSIEAVETPLEVQPAVVESKADYHFDYTQLGDSYTGQKFFGNSPYGQFALHGGKPSFFSNKGLAESDDVLPTGQFSVVTYRLHQDFVEIKVNGGAWSGTPPAEGEGALRITVNDVVSLGNSKSTCDTNAFQGRIAEVLVYDDVLNDEKIDTVEKYIHGKWWGQKSFPVTAPPEATVAAPEPASEVPPKELADDKSTATPIDRAPKDTSVTAAVEQAQAVVELQQTFNAETSPPNDNVHGATQDTTTAAPKGEAEATPAPKFDPRVNIFEWVPPSESDPAKAEQWTRTVKEKVDYIRNFQLGGDVLRVMIRQHHDELVALREQLFD
ncbi:unnamed protein product [Phytophthora lilii]|uniref:Unnamed protein product n=1 Tax=Phytophthora lilii TaxID=2077276 RepID=A0A9W6X0Y3_9STRA|nr:unnamed protein product [Phytophthora lilii]